MDKKTLQRREFLQIAGAAVSVTAAAVLSPACTGQTPASKWHKADRSRLKEYPTLSLKERDSRYDKVRKMLQDNKVEALYVPGGASAGGAGGPDYYFTNDVATNVVFPIEGEPTALVPSPNSTCISAGAIYMDEVRGYESWIRDWRFGKGRQSDLFDLLKEKKLANTRVGVVGVAKHGHSTYETPDALVALNQNPLGIIFVELRDDFLPIWMTHSEEDIALYRKASLMAEVACEAGLEATKPGATEVQVYTAIMAEAARMGARLTGMNFTLGPDTVTWGGSRYLVRPEKPLTIKEGDILNIEILPHYGGMQAQAQLAIGVGNVSDLNVKLGNVAREMYDAGVKTIRPGVKFREVCDAMNAANLREGYWHETPNIHSVNPLELVSQVTEGVEQFAELVKRFGLDNLPELEITGPDVVLQTGMMFQLEPNACSGRHRVNIGGNVLVTEKGCEALNDVCCELRIV